MLVARHSRPGRLDRQVSRHKGGRLMERLWTRRHAETYLQELRQMKPALPTRTVSTTVTDPVGTNVEAVYNKVVKKS
jgi:hypothetical protein